MKTSELSEVLSIFSKVCRRSAMTDEYRCLLLSPTGIRGAAPFGVVEADIELPIREPAYVDGEKFIALIKTFVADEVELDAKKTSLHWSCGSARGQFGLRAVKPPPLIKLPSEERLDLSEEFGDALSLAATSCDSPALLAMGLYGVVLEPIGEDLVAYASNNRTVSSAVLGAADSFSSNLTLSPDAVRLLVLASREEGAVLSAEESLIGVEAPRLRLLLRQVAPLKQDVRSTVTKFTKSEKSVALQRGPISEFLRRVSVLTEDRGQSRVRLTVQKNRTLLEFQNGSYSSEGWCENEGADFSASADIDLMDFSAIVGKVDHIVFDYVDSGIVVLTGSEGRFRYMIDCSRE